MTKDAIEDSWAHFARMCLSFESPEELQKVLDLFLTIEEKETLSARYQIVKALLEGTLTQREIAQKLKVSIAQITRGSNALKIISPKLREHLTRNMQT
jgi:TrpR family transcriptional regulator, trp operon repressor